MSRTISPSSQQPYSVARVIAIWGDVARSTFYAARKREQQPREARKRGPKVLTDEELIAEIRQLLVNPIFTGEGYRKIWARLRQKSVRTSKDRLLPLLRQERLLSPARQPDTPAGNPHEGTIVTETPNRMWGTDATATFTDAEGTVTVFAAIDHCSADCVGIHAVKKATRFEALEPIRQGVRQYCGNFSAGIAAGLQLRHDHGSVYMSDDFQNEISFLGMEPSPAFVSSAGRRTAGDRLRRPTMKWTLPHRRFGGGERTSVAGLRDDQLSIWMFCIYG